MQQLAPLSLSSNCRGSLPPFWLFALFFALVKSHQLCLTQSQFPALKCPLLSASREKRNISCPLHLISVTAWQPNVSICPVKCLETYLDRTASLRNANNSTSLLLSTNRPHGPAAVATVGRWIKEQLQVAGIDTSIFSAHSTRGAAASKAAAAGVPIQTILDSGHWSRESTFARFYHREVVTGPSNLVTSSVLRPVYDASFWVTR